MSVTYTLAQPDLTRVPILVGESKWARAVNGARIKSGLIRKASMVTDDTESLRYAVCAREQIEHADDETLTVTAEDIFAT